MDSSTKLIVRILVPILLAGVMFILRSRGNDNWFSIVFTFFTISIGFLAAHFLGTWYRIIPGLALDTVQGVAIAKFAEVLPIVVSVIVLGFLYGENWTSLRMKGGRLGTSMKLGVAALPLSYLSFLFMGGTIIVMAGNEFLVIIPWLLLFALSNAFMEELIFRGAFLDKLEKQFGERVALVQISLIFAIFHVSILQATGFEMIVAFTAFIMILGLAWGYIVQKSDSIWGAVLAHAVADIFVIIIGLGLV
jgi:membrane protease YdiL (CAAX protease family)